DVCEALDSGVTQQKLAAADLAHLNGLITRKKFEFKGPGGLDREFRDKPRKFIITSAPAFDRDDNTTISEIAFLGSRIDTFGRDLPGAAPLYIDRAALQTIREHIHGGRRVAETRVEQGGFLIGQPIRTRQQQRTAIITLALPARETRG